MSGTTGIEWTDATWNPTTGCNEVSPGCDRCYAKIFAERFRGVAGHYFEGGFDIQLRPDKLTLPLTWRKPKRIFVNSMSDLFHDQVSDEYIARVFAVMAYAHRHTFQILTKRHARMRSLLASERFVDLFDIEFCKLPDWASRWPDPEDAGHLMDGPLPNVWLGVSAENQQWADIRIPALLDTPAAVRFISAEPLLGPIDLGLFLEDDAEKYDVPALDWVIVGGESGRSARPMHSDWATSLLMECRSAGVPFLFKQWGNWISDVDRVVQLGYDRDKPHALVNVDSGAVVKSSDEIASGSWMHVWNVGKAKAGRELLLRTWDEYPGGVTR